MAIKIFKIITVIILNIYLIIRLFQGNYGLLSGIIWILSVFIFYNIFQSPRQKNNHNFLIPPILFFVLIIVFIIKIIFISMYPSSLFFHGDEAINSRNAQINYELGMIHGQWNILGSGMGTMNEMPALWYFLQGGIINVLGPNLLSIKIFALASDIFLSCFIFLIIKKSFNQLLAYFGTILYISFPIAIHFSMTGYQNLQSTVMLYWAVYLLYLIPSKPKNHDLIYYSISSGIVSGFSLYFYLSSTINILICMLIIVFMFLFRDYEKKLIKKIKYMFVSISYFLLAFIVVAIPYLYYSIYKYNFILGRSGEIIVNKFVFSEISILISQVIIYVKNLLPSGIFNGSGQHYINQSLFPNLILFLFFIVGFIISILNYKKIKYSTPLIIFLLTSITAGLLTRDTPAPQRLIHIFPSVILFVLFTISIIKNKKIQIIITVCFFITNLYSYVFKNIALYKNNNILPVYAYDVAKLYENKSTILYLSAPIHKKDQIYYYSEAKINPISILHNDFGNIDTGYFFIDDISLVFLNTYKTKKYELIKEWFNEYGHTMLIKI